MTERPARKCCLQSPLSRATRSQIDLTPRCIYGAILALKTNDFSRRCWHQTQRSCVLSTTLGTLHLTLVIDVMQWELTFDEVVKTFTTHQKSYGERLAPIVERQCECLVESLNQDVVGTVFAYLGFDLAKRLKKRKRLIRQPIDRTLSDKIG